MPKNALLDLDDFDQKDNVDMGDFYEETVKEMQYDNKQYGIPLLVDNRSLSYNKTLTEKKLELEPHQRLGMSCWMLRRKQQNGMEKR